MYRDSVVKHLPSMYRALGSIPSDTKNKRKKSLYTILCIDVGSVTRFCAASQVLIIQSGSFTVHDRLCRARHKKHRAT